MKMRAGLLGFALWAGLLVTAGARAEERPEVVALPTESAVAPRSHEVLPASCQAFQRGYQAYQVRQLPAAIRELAAAARECFMLGDYALYYLGLARRDNNDSRAAAQTFERLRDGYPQSILVSNGELELAQIELGLGNLEKAAAVARRIIGGTGDSQVEQGARSTLAGALDAAGDYRSAYLEFMTLREKYPQGSFDERARAAAYTLIGAHPEVADKASLEYRRGEGALLIREGQSVAAQQQLKAALQVSPLPARAELLWLLGRAERSEPGAERSTLLAYLAAAPRGPWAAAALDRLGHLYWRANDTVNARRMFTRVTRGFPQSSYAPEAMFAIGRSFEDDRRFERARAKYRELLRRYPESEAAQAARFRIPWTLYMAHRFAKAAGEFAAMKPRSAPASERDMFSYWEGRALERSGKTAATRVIFRGLALSTASNYYPALAAARTGARPPALAAASVPDSAARLGLETVAGRTGFHLDRVMALRTLGLRELEPGELRAIEPGIGANPGLRSFVLDEFQAAGDWYDAIVAATRLSSHGQISPEVVERVRYPLGFAELIIPAAREAGIEPHLVMSLTRQESFFDPRARSVSGARGLMQLLPKTAVKMAVALGHQGAALDLYDPALNVNLGVALLKKLLALYAGNRFKAVAAYNGGEPAVARWNLGFPGDDDAWVENIGYRETREYVKKVIGGFREYDRLYPDREVPGAVGNRAHPAAEDRYVAGNRPQLADGRS